MQALDDDRLRDFLLDELPQPHPRNRRERRLSGCGQCRQYERHKNYDELEPGSGIQVLAVT
jgi:hypothetical protein